MEEDGIKETTTDPEYDNMLLEPHVEISTQDNDEQDDNFFPFNTLAVEINEDPDGNAGDDVNQEEQENAQDLGDSLAEGLSLEKEIYNTSAVADSTVPESNESSHDATVFEEEINPQELQETYWQDFYSTSTPSNFEEEASHSSTEDAVKDDRRYSLALFPRVVKALQEVEYETLQVLYQLLYQRSAWDTEEILKQRILEFSGFGFNSKSEEYFNRDMMLKTQPNDVLIKIGQILGLDHIQKMVVDGDKARCDLISAIMNFLTVMKQFARSRRTKPANDSSKTPTTPTPVGKCGCRSDCLKKTTKKQRQALLEYLNSLDDKLLDSYLFSLLEVTKHEKKMDSKKVRGVAYQYKVKLGKTEFIVCKGAYAIYHGLTKNKVMNLQSRLKSGKDIPPKRDISEFPEFIDPGPPKIKEVKVVIKPIPIPIENKYISSVTEQDQKPALTVSAESNGDLKDSTPKQKTPEMPVKSADIYDSSGTATEKETTKKVSNDSESSKNKKLKEYPLVVTAIENASAELLIDVHFLLFLDSAKDDEVKENILNFDGFSFNSDTEEYDERNEFLQRMSFKIVGDVARSFSLAILENKEDTIKNILSFLQSPSESYLKAECSMPLSLSDVELDDIEGFSDSDESITCEVVEKKVECIDLISSGEESGDEGKPKKVKTPKKSAPAAVPPKPIPKIPSSQPVSSQIISQPTVKQVVTVNNPLNMQSISTNSTSELEPAKLQSGTRKLRDFETICKIVNTHPHEYLVDIYDLLYLKKHDPHTLRKDILDFSGFTFEKGSPEYVKRKQLLDRMLYNSVRRIYNTLIHNTTEVKVFSKPTMITEIFQFLFKLPDHDTSRPTQTPKSITKPALLNVTKSNIGTTPPPAAAATTLPPNPSGKLSDLKRVFQRVACFPCEYLIDVHKLLFMTDCDPKVIRQNIFAFKGFDFGSDSQDFQQRKMYLEYLTFHSLRKISSVLTTRSVDLRNSTKHELASHLTQVLAEYCNTHCETEIPEIHVSNQPSQPTSTVTSTSDAAVENIVVTPSLDSLADPPVEPIPTRSPASSTTTKTTAAPKTQTSSLPISIVDARSISSPSVTTTSKGQKKRKSATVSKLISEKKAAEPNQFADINLPEVEKYSQMYGPNLNIYNTNIPTITGITTFSAAGIPQTFPMAQPVPFPIMQVQPSQVIGVPVISQVQSKPSEVIVPEKCEEEQPAKKQKVSENSEKNSSKKSSSADDSNTFHNKIRDAIADDEEDCDKPLASLIGHPIDNVLKKNILEIVEQTDLQDITINGVIQKVFAMYPKFDLSYRKEFIKSTVRSLLYKLGEQKNGIKADSRDTNSPDCSVTTTDIQDNSLDNSNENSMECS